MDFEPAELASQLALWQDDELLRRCERGFAAEARPWVVAELARRGLEWPAVPPLEDVAPDEPCTPYEGDWTLLARYLTPTEAHVLKSFLTSADIPATVDDVHVTQFNQLWAQATGGACVRVPANFVEEAKELLAAFRRGEFELGDDFDGAA